MAKLLKKLTRELTDKEAIYIGAKIWWYALDLAVGDAETAAEKKEVRSDFAEKVRDNIRKIFTPVQEQKSWINDLSNLNNDFAVDDEEGKLDLYTAMLTFNYLHKIGVLV